MSLASNKEFTFFGLYHLLWTALDWLYPPQCAGCNEPGVGWCSSCKKLFQHPGKTICPICGDIQGSETICNACIVSPPAYKMLRSCGLFLEPLTSAVHQLKYNNNLGLGILFSQYLVELYQQLNWRVDMITAVPLSHKRTQERGYNQSAMLALPMALSINIPFKPSALRRIRETKSQVGLGKPERAVNVRDAFQSSPKLVQGKTVLVIDDVITTGATMQACTTALLAAGAASVYGMSLARAVYHSDSAHQVV
jgi:competence protein ComFC